MLDAVEEVYVGKWEDEGALSEDAHKWLKQKVAGLLETEVQEVQQKCNGELWERSLAMIPWQQKAVQEARERSQRVLEKIEIIRLGQSEALKSMRRRSQFKEESGKLPPEKSVPILERIIGKGEKLGNVSHDSPEVTRWAETAEQALAAALGSSHDTVESFRREFHCGVSYVDDSPAEQEQQFQGQLRRGLAVLESAVQQVRWQLPDPGEVFLPAGSHHDAYREIRNIIAQAGTQVLIVDPFVDHTLWQLLTNLPATTRIRILTDQMKGDFLLEGKKFAAQRHHSVEVRQTRSYHDRFVVLDGSSCWHLGASIKDAGAKACMISKLDRAELLRTVIADIESVWGTSPAVAL